MKRLDFCGGWRYGRLGNDAPLQAVPIPHDAMLAEKRTANAECGINGAWFEGFDYEYEKVFVFDPAWEGKNLTLEFEGVYRKAEVWLNGEKLAFRPYGYTNFYVPLTGKLRTDADNTLRVIARNADQPNCRWYSGAGIYRPVALWVGEREHILLNGVKIRTVSHSPAAVEVTVQTSCPGEVRVEILDAQRVLADTQGSAGEKIILQLPDACAWSPENPKLYTCRVRFGDDEATQVFGIRTLSWGVEDGFCINGERVILRGACIHHDNGILGAVCDPDAVERKVRLLMENGYNAIRSAHNPCSKTLLDICDRLGMLVMDEYIDHWYIHKNQYDYVEFFDEWWHQDLRDMVQKDYNHPCVIMYSTGNEVSETAQERGIALTKELTQWLHSLDDSRPVTCGVNILFNFLNSIGFGMYSDDKAEKEARQAAKNKAAGKKAKKSTPVGSQFFNELTGLVGAEFMKYASMLHGCDVKTRDAFANMDIAGYNYGIYRYPGDLKRHPQRLILGSETFCNDAYRFWEQARDEKRLIGDFVWAGMDYLGEVGVGSWEYKDYAPDFSHGVGWISAGSGRIDLTGKPLCEAAYTRVAFELERGPRIGVRPVDHTASRHSPSAWKMTNAMESWSWDGCEGKKAHVEVYARAFEVELIRNGRSLGRKKPKNDCIVHFVCAYEPGKLEAVSYDAAGREIGRTCLRTATGKTQLCAQPEKAAAQPGKLSYVRLRYCGEDGITRPLERGVIKATVRGGSLVALGSACPYYDSSYLDDTTDTYYGEALAVIRAGEEEVLTLHLTDGTLETTVQIPIQKEENVC